MVFWFRKLISDDKFAGKVTDVQKDEFAAQCSDFSFTVAVKGDERPGAMFLLVVLFLFSAQDDAIETFSLY